MVATARWNALKKRLESTAGHDFERALFPLLKIRWPDLVYPKSLKYLDKSGIDQVLVVDGSSRLGAVIQCKGFEVLKPLSRSQVDQVDGSIKRFEASGYSTTEYVLIYNRFGAEQEFEQAAKARLQELVKSGRAGKATIWNLNSLVTELSSSLLDYLLRELAEKAAQKHQSERQRFRFGAVLVEHVPYSLGNMQLDSGTSPAVERTSNVTVGDPLDAITLDRRSVSLVIGSFGSGKSTLGYRLAERPNRKLVFVPAAALTHTEAGAPSENSLAQAIVEYLGIFDDARGLTDEQREQLSHLAGPLLSAKLRTEDSGLTLLIDAIDESRFYSTAKGLQTLTNELSRALCPVIITTRLEHFVDSFEAFEGALDAKSPFGVRQVQLLTLNSWSGDQADQYVREATKLAEAQGEAEVAQRLLVFQRALHAGSFSGLAVQHPLFLAMSTDLAASGDTRIYDERFKLYERWVHEKLRRDFCRDRWIPQGFKNIRLLVSTLMDLMGLIAAHMHGFSEPQGEVAEYIEESAVRHLAADAFGVPVASELYTTTSLLVPMRVRSFGSVRLRFFHKSFQDYFAARWLHNGGANRSVGIPLGVQTFLRSIEQEGDG